MSSRSDESPTVSIVIPLFNQGEFLDEAVASCRLQTFDDIEIIVVDDGSDDPATRELLEGYRRPGVRLLRTETNRGVSAARNLGVSESRGRFISFLDADDRLHPRFVEATVAELEADRQLDFASCWIEAFGVERWTYRPTRCDLVAVAAECTVATPALVRRDAFDRVEGFAPVPNEDWDFWIAVVASGGRGVIVPEVLFSYRRRSGTEVERVYYSDVLLDSMRALVERHPEVFSTHLEEILEWKRRELADLEAEGRWFGEQVANRSARLDAWRGQ